MQQLNHVWHSGVKFRQLKRVSSFRWWIEVIEKSYSPCQLAKEKATQLGRMEISNSGKPKATESRRMQIYVIRFTTETEGMEPINITMRLRHGRLEDYRL